MSETDSRTIQFGGSNHVTYDIDEEPDSGHRVGCVSSVLSTCWSKSFGKIGGDWLFLALLGIIMSAIAVFVDYCIGICMLSRYYLYRDLIHHPALQYLGWIWLPLCLILFSTSLTRLLAPQAAGSGIPEMKTILLGITPKKSFTVKGLITKIIGLTATLGTGLPLGKEGPFVHIASMTAVLLTKVTTPFKGIFENKTRHKDMLAAACAVGVAMAFAAPVGGVLFSIEVTAVHFAVRNYWRGFFAAVCATVLNRFIAVWVHKEATLTAIYFTRFSYDAPYSPEQMIAFVFIGIICGFLGALFIWAHRKYVTFKNNNRIMKALSQKSMLLYPFLVTLLYMSLTFPLGLGMFVAGEITTYNEIAGMFSNFSWTKENPTTQEFEVISQWRTSYTSVFANLFLYAVFTFLGTILASTIPVPAGIFIPVFKTGAAIGRIIGELMYVMFPAAKNSAITIIPGGYSIVGAAALAGAVTHTVSSSVIAFELTGQMTFAIPIMVAVFIANGIAQALQPSIFDSIITMKKLPYLPSIPSTGSKAYDIYVEDFMVKDVKFVWYGITYNTMLEILTSNKKIKTFPIVDSADSMILLGSAKRQELETLIKDHIGPRRKMFLLDEWRNEAERCLDNANRLLDLARTSRVQIRVTPQRNLSDIFHNNNMQLPAKGSSVTSLPLSPQKAEDPMQLEAVAKSDANLDNTESSKSADMDTKRRPSRFSVTKVESPTIKITPESDTDTIEEKEEELPPSQTSTITYGSLPRKGILKKTQSFVLDSSKRSPRFLAKYPHNTIHSEDLRGFKQSLTSMLKSKSLLRIDSKSPQVPLTEIIKDELPTRHLVDKIRQLELDFEEREMKKTVDFTTCQINPAPHQLVERSNLLQVHSIFSLLGLQHSYVTAIGRLIGVVGLKELREVIERLNSGEFDRRGANIRKFSLGFLSIR